MELALMADGVVEVRKGVICYKNNTVVLLLKYTAIKYIHVNKVSNVKKGKRVLFLSIYPIK